MPQDVSPVSHIGPMNPIIKLRLKRLEVAYERHENRLNEHDVRLNEQEERLAKKGGSMERSNEILESRKITHCEYLEWTRATHGIVPASYFRWHGEDATVDHLEAEKFGQFYQMRRMLSKGPSRGQTTEPTMRSPNLD